MEAERKNEATPDPWITVTEAARRIGVAPQTVHLMALRGDLEHTIAATRVFIGRESVERYLAAQSPSPAA